jgi:CBS domain-containing protein
MHIVIANLTSPRDQKPAERDTRSVLTPVLDFLSRHAPFDRMAAQHLEFLAMRLKLGFYAKGEVITEPGRGAAGTFYVIKQGRVRGETEGERGPAENGAWELVAGECFPIGALLARRAVHTVHRAIEDTFCYELEREDFERLLAQSPVFHDFCSRRLANLLDQALAHVKATIANEVSADTSLNTPLHSLVRRAPVTCAPGTRLREAVTAMSQARVGSIVVTDALTRPLGIFTLHDLLGRVVTRDVGLDVPIESVMTPKPAALSPQAFAHEAAAEMARHGFGHLCVVEEDRLVGVISERDLFAMQRIGLVSLSRAITHAPDVATLTRLGQDVHRLIDQMLAQGASVAQLTQIITLLNDHVTRRVIALVKRESAVSADFTWLSFGSEGRQEQTLKTDQDNGIVFAADGRDPEATRAGLLPFARRVNEALAAVGYPLCAGNVMAGNPECCLSEEEWRARFAHWIDQGGPEHLLKASIFFDFRALDGDAGPVERLREWVTGRVGENQRFLRQMAQNALRNSPPLGLVRDFVVESAGEHANTIDLKLRGTMPFVDGARLLALAHGVADTNTVNRLQALAERDAVRRDEADAWCDAYAYLQLLRLRRHRDREVRGLEPDNHVSPDALNELDRRILKEVFRQARKLQTRIALDYRL